MSVELHEWSGGLVAVDIEAGKQPDLLWTIVAIVERAMAAVLLVVLFPILLACAVVVVVLSRRGPLVRHSRVGQHGRNLQVLKLRTMWGPAVGGCGRGCMIEAVTDNSELSLKLPRDPRVISRFAALCRKYSVDELPQLWQVIQGDMSFVGPRPLTAKEIKTYYGADSIKLLSVKPGLSGLWQVDARSSASREQRRELDLFMIENWSLKLYLRILQATIPTVLSGRNAW